MNEYTKNFIKLDDEVIKKMTVAELDIMITKVATAVNHLDKLLTRTSVFLELRARSKEIVSNSHPSLQGLVSLFPALGEIMKYGPHENGVEKTLEQVEFYGIKASVIFNYIEEMVGKTLTEFWETDLFNVNHFALAHFPKKYIATIAEFFKDILFRTNTNLKLLDISNTEIREIEFKGRMCKIYKKSHKIIYMLDCIQNLMNTFEYRKNIFEFTTTNTSNNVSVEILTNVNNYSYIVYDKSANARKNGYKPYIVTMCKMIDKQVKEILDKNDDVEE